MEETKQLAKFARNLAYADLPEAVIDKTKELILDQLGCQLAGSTLPWTQPAYDYVVECGGRPESTIVRHGSYRGHPQCDSVAGGRFAKALMVSLSP